MTELQKNAGMVVIKPITPATGKEAMQNPERNFPVKAIRKQKVVPISVDKPEKVVLVVKKRMGKLRSPISKRNSRMMKNLTSKN